CDQEPARIRQKRLRSMSPTLAKEYSISCGGRTKSRHWERRTLAASGTASSDGGKYKVPCGIAPGLSPLSTGTARNWRAAGTEIRAQQQIRKVRRLSG